MVEMMSGLVECNLILLTYNINFLHWSDHFCISRWSSYINLLPVICTL